MEYNSPLDQNLLCDCRKPSFKCIEQDDLPNMIHFECDQSQNAPGNVRCDENIFGWSDREKRRAGHLADSIDNKICCVQIVEILSFEVKGIFHAADIRRRVARPTQSKQEPYEREVRKNCEV